ncbi:MAG: hypothetical protein HFH37_00965 [Lachnospiraceae bacterium]|nr:hypothetical protein [Lachnospiraceae bacterium]
MGKGSRMKRIISIWLCFCLAIAAAFPMGENLISAEAAQTNLPELLASYPLLTDLKDVSGNGRDGKAVGNLRYYNGLTFPGNNDSSTNYAELPQGMLDGQDTLTISVWLKNRTGTGNYAAMSFCSPVEALTDSPNYWLFVPSNPKGLYKNVFTNGVNAKEPFRTEVGVIEGDTTGLERKWAQYTVVLTANSISSYLNGNLVGTAEKSRTTTDFGQNLLVYLGRSGYAKDQAFAGSMKELRIYGGVLTPAQIQTAYEAERAVYDFENENTKNEPAGVTEYIPQIRRATDASSGLSHPGIGMSADQLETMQRHVRAGDEPWLSGYGALINNPKAALNPRLFFQPDNDIFIHIPGPWAIEGYSNPGEFVSQRCQMDSLTAAHQALMWYITGNEQYRRNVFAILDNFALVESAVDHTDFRFGDVVYNLCFAAEILRYTECDNEELQWTQEDTDKLTGFMNIVHKFYDATWFWMNQHSFNVLGMMGESIFTNDAVMYGKAVERTLVNTEGEHGGRNGSVKYQIRKVEKNDLTGEILKEPNIQLMEMGRDQGHAYGNLGGLSELVASIYAQGTLVDPEEGTISTAANAVNPFEFQDDRLLAGASYLAKYHLGYEVTWIPADSGVSSSSPNGIYKSINGYPWKGNLSNYYGIVYNYYKYIAKADMSQEKYRYVADAYESIMPEGASGDFIGLSTLMFTPEAAAADGISRKKDFSGDTKTISQTEYFSALRRGTAEVMKEGDTTFVRANASAAGTEFVIHHFGYPKKGLVALKVRSNGDAQIRLGCQEADHDPAAVFEVHNTGGKWQTVFYDLSKSENTAASMVYYTITGNATQVDMDYLEFDPAQALPQIKEIHHEIDVLSQTQKDGTVKEYVAVGEKYQTKVVLADAVEGVIYGVQGLPQNASVDKTSGVLEWTPGASQAGQEFTLRYFVEKNGAVSYCSRNVYVYDSVYGLLAECVKGVASGDYEKQSAEQFKSAYSAALAEGKRSCATAAFREKADALIQAAKNLKYLMYYFDFEGNSENEKRMSKGLGKEALSLSGNAEIIFDREMESYVLSLDGVYGTFAQLPQKLLEGIDCFTVRMYVKPTEDGRIFSFGSSEKSFLDISGGSSQITSKIVKNGVSLETEKSLDNVPADEWYFVVLEVTPATLSLYKNGDLIAEKKDVGVSAREIGENLSVMLGQSFSIEDDNFKGCLDDVRIFCGGYRDDFRETMYLDMPKIIVKVPVNPATPPSKPSTSTVKKVTLNVTKATVGVGETLDLKAKKTPAKAKTTYRWKSSAPKIVSVSKKGRIKAKKKGKATITVMSSNGKKAVCKITVKKAPKKIEFRKKSLTLKKGKSTTLKVKLPAGTASRRLSFSSSKKSVASVTAKGKVTAKKVGTAKITVKTYNKKKAAITVKVKKR